MLTESDVEMVGSSGGVAGLQQCRAKIQLRHTKFSVERHCLLEALARISRIGKVKVTLAECIHRFSRSRPQLRPLFQMRQRFFPLILLEQQAAKKEVSLCIPRLILNYS